MLINFFNGSRFSSCCYLIPPWWSACPQFQDFCQQYWWNPSLFFLYPIRLSAILVNTCNNVSTFVNSTELSAISFLVDACNWRTRRLLSFINFGYFVRKFAYFTDLFLFLKRFFAFFVSILIVLDLLKTLSLTIFSVFRLYDNLFFEVKIRIFT